MSVVATASTDDEVRLLVDVSVMRVEVLGVVVVEHASGAIVLLKNTLNHTHVPWLILAPLNVHVTLGAQPWMVHDLLHLGLAFVLSALHGKFVNWLIPGLITPVADEGLSMFLLFNLGSAEEVGLPGDSPVEVVPVGATVDGGGGDHAPQNPTHLADHPHVGLTHVIRNMKHHCCLFTRCLQISKHKRFNVKMINGDYNLLIN